MSLLEIEAIDVFYGRVQATRRVSFGVDNNEVLTLIGSNGAGKSSILKSIIGAAAIRNGHIGFDGSTISGLRTYEIIRRGIAYSPEGRRVFNALSVRDNLMAGGHSIPRAAVPHRLGQVYEYFPRLKERATQPAGSLSGGEQQMLAIGRALMAKPRLLLLDEPSLGLAPVM